MFVTSTNVLANLKTEPIEYQDKLNNIVQSPTWSVLLHVKNNQPKIKDPAFILSYKNFSLKAELDLTLKVFQADYVKGYCRFPARYLYLSKTFDLPSVDLVGSDQCPELSLYLRKVPYDKLSLVFASEVLESASSMMGHVFLKAEGKNDNGKAVAHSVSFFSEYTSYNPFKLLYDGLLGGMNGFFIVRQFDTDLLNYSQNEQRNVFEYDIKFNDFEKQLIRFHIWELKGIEVTYLFQSYNCATLTLYILSLGEVQLKKSENVFVSPADVVKALAIQDLLGDSKVTISDKWELKLLQEQLSDVSKEQVEKVVTGKLPVEKLRELTSNDQIIVDKYLNLLLKKNQVKTKLSASQQKELSDYLNAPQSHTNSNSRLFIDFSAYNNPLDSQQDSILSASIFSENTNNFVDLTFLPASHYLRSRNRQFFSESELKLAETKFRVNTSQLAVELRSFALYSVLSLMPSHQFQSEYSRSFYLGYRQHLTKNLSDTGMLTISGGLGKTYKLHQDVMIFGLLNAGLAANLKKSLAYIEPQIGVIFNLAYDMKLIAQQKYTFSSSNERGIHSSEVEWTYHANNSDTFSVKYLSLNSFPKNNHILKFNYDYHF